MIGVALRARAVAGASDEARERHPSLNDREWRIFEYLCGVADSRKAPLTGRFAALRMLRWLAAWEDETCPDERALLHGVLGVGADVLRMLEVGIDTPLRLMLVTERVTWLREHAVKKDGDYPAMRHAAVLVLALVTEDDDTWRGTFCSCVGRVVDALGVPDDDESVGAMIAETDARGAL